MTETTDFGLYLGDYGGMRRRMVVEQLVRRGIRDQRVIAAMARVPRHLFVPAAMRASAYEDRPLPIGFGQTISQPFMVASMLAEARLSGSERVLDVGTGSGYQAAVLGELAREVISIEIVSELAHRASQTLADLGANNVQVVVGDGSVGWPEGAPYDVIVVAAAAPHVPEELLEQLADGGRLLIPVGPSGGVQVLTRVTRSGGRTRMERLEDCMFVPLVGRRGDRGGLRLH